jgi:4-oxalocrotonate tautomerase family enzyme
MRCVNSNPGGQDMPQVNIQVIGELPSDAQKAAIFAKITDLMVDVLGRTRKLVVVSIAASPVSDWAVGGEAVKADGLVGIQAVIRIIAGANSDEQKSRMIAEMTTVLTKELGDPILPLYVTFDEVPVTAWGYNGRTVAEIAAAKSA